MQREAVFKEREQERRDASAKLLAEKREEVAAMGFNYSTELPSPVLRPLSPVRSIPWIPPPATISPNIIREIEDETRKENAPVREARLRKHLLEEIRMFPPTTGQGMSF